MSPTNVPSFDEPLPEPVRITTLTRTHVADTFTLERISWSGVLSDDDFLARLFDLKKLPSTDGRFSDAAGDIWQHCVRNTDWPADWVFTDDRFDLLHGPDDVFLRFLCETLHPVVRRDAEEGRRLLALLNAHLRADGWEIVPDHEISGYPVYAGRRLLAGADHGVSAARAVAQVLNAEHITQQVERLKATSDRNVDLAIGTAKEFVESICRGILEERRLTYDKGADTAQLVKAVLKEIDLVPAAASDPTKGAETVRVLASALTNAVTKLGELRNQYGTGHGKAPSARGLAAHHAHLAVNAAATIATFLFEAHRATGTS